MSNSLVPFALIFHALIPGIPGVPFVPGLPGRPRGPVKPEQQIISPPNSQTYNGNKRSRQLANMRTKKAAGYGAYCVRF